MNAKFQAKMIFHNSYMSSIQLPLSYLFVLVGVLYRLLAAFLDIDKDHFYYLFLSLLPKEVPHLALISQAVSDKKMFKNNGHVHVNSPGAGADTPLDSLFYPKTQIFR